MDRKIMSRLTYIYMYVCMKTRIQQFWIKDEKYPSTTKGNMGFFPTVILVYHLPKKTPQHDIINIVDITQFLSEYENLPYYS